MNTKFTNQNATHLPLVTLRDRSTRSRLFLGVGCAAGLSLAIWSVREETLADDAPPVKSSTAFSSAKFSATTWSTTQPRSLDEIDRTADAPELLAVLRKKRSDGSAKDVLVSLLEISRSRPALALELAQTAGRTAEEKSAWLTEVMQEWSHRDATKAWAWLLQQTPRMDDLADGSLTSVVFRGMAANDPAQLIETVQAQLGPENTSGPFASQVVVHTALEALIQKGAIDVARDAVERWAQDPARPAIGAAAYETVALALGKFDPRTAGAWLNTLPASPERNSALATFAADWGERDPRAALHWAETLAPQDGATAAIQRTFGDWIERHPGDAGEWLGGYLLRAPGGDGTDRLIGSVINLPVTVQAQPALALQWVDLISNPTDRKRETENVIVKWSRRDFAEALNYVRDSSSIAAEDKTVLRQKIEEDRVSGKTYD